MAMGLPVIATKCSSFSEIIQHPNNGILIDINDPMKIAESVISLVTSAHYYEFLSFNALNRSKSFSITNTVSKLQSIYSGLINISGI